MPPTEVSRIAGRLADAGVSVTLLPATDPYLMGRDQDHAVRGGVADANFLLGRGVNCSISSNNVLNPATPYGDCSLIRMANLQANPSAGEPPSPIARLFAMLTDRSTRILNWPITSSPLAPRPMSRSLTARRQSAR